MILEAIILGTVILLAMFAAVAVHALRPTDQKFTIPTSHQGAAVAPSEPGQEPVTLKSGEGRSN